ncbi:NADPH-dependent FMN reductase [Pseudonocardia spinosispora]|uniref:NADPH-dependent FMN reductase n=1 Tax=Pseudonocardia spinosispora TaxID=103441 RepID=UPI00048C61C5|nr:NADPH-dependent FMN reductase [Pseudonocardia spinosispora]
MPRVLVIAGSVRQSYTAALTRTVTEALIERGAHVDLWHDPALPTADPAYHRNPQDHPDPEVRRLVGLADEANALVLASPLYHNSFSGVLKNLLDHLSMEQLRYKPVGLLGHGRNRSTQAVDQLRTVVRGLRGVTTTTPLCTVDADYHPDHYGTLVLTDPDIRSRLTRFTDELLTFTTALTPLRA